MSPERHWHWRGSKGVAEGQVARLKEVGEAHWARLRSPASARLNDVNEVVGADEDREEPLVRLRTRHDPHAHLPRPPRASLAACGGRATEVTGL